MNKREFFDRLLLASRRARDLASRLVEVELPEDACFTISAFGSTLGRQMPGKIKFLGGRFLEPEEFQQLPWRRAASLLWVDGKVPAWINLGVVDWTEQRTEFVIRYCGQVVPADEKRLPPDWGCEKGNELVPFRIRGPSEHELRKIRSRLTAEGRASVMPKLHQKLRKN